MPRMTAVLTPPPPAARFTPPRHFDNGAEWLRALGDVPMERIVFDPWPGTATEADLLVFVERDKRLCELIDGTLVEKPVGYWEGVIAMNLEVELSAHARKLDAGAVSGADSTMRMKSSNRVRLPDVAFVSKERLPKTLAPIPTLAPDLAVEVLSKTNTRAEMAQKLIEYFQSGTRLAWIIDPQTRTVAIYHAPGEPTRVLDITGELDSEQVLPGFKLPVAEAFRGVPADAGEP
jgi:Uma2 family endonuclease